MKFLMGLDLGTTALKAAVFDTAGRLLAMASQEYTLLTPGPGYVEQEPGVYWEAFRAAVSALKQTFG